MLPESTKRSKGEMHRLVTQYTLHVTLSINSNYNVINGRTWLLSTAGKQILLDSLISKYILMKR